MTLRQLVFFDFGSTLNPNPIGKDKTLTPNLLLCYIGSCESTCFDIRLTRRQYTTIWKHFMVQLLLLLRNGRQRERWGGCKNLLFLWEEYLHRFIFPQGENSSRLRGAIARHQFQGALVSGSNRQRSFLRPIFPPSRPRDRDVSPSSYECTFSSFGK